MSRYQFNEDTHTYYTPEGEIIPSVTQCIKYIQGDLYKDIPRSILYKAAEYGTRVHKILEDLEDGYEHEDLSVYEKNAIKQYKKIKDFKTNFTEVFVTYKDIYCGLVDGIGDKVIYDIKTTSKVNKDYISLQLSLYLLAYDEDNYYDYKGYVLWLPKKGIGKKIEIELIDKIELYNLVEKIKELRSELND